MSDQLIASRENGESYGGGCRYANPVPSLLGEPQEGVETRVDRPERRPMKLHECATSHVDEEIVRHPSESRGPGIKSPGLTIRYIISPIDNPVASMSRSINATGKLHEWTEDELQAAGVNAHVEGADAPADTSAPVVELNNYCQIMSKTAKISGTLEEVDKYGRDSELAYQLELRYSELANDEEMAIVGAPGGARQTAAAGDAATARTMASLHNQLHADVIVDGNPATTLDALEGYLLEAHQACYQAGGNPNYLFTPPALAPHIAGLAYASGRQRDLRNERALVNVIDQWSPC